MGDVASRRGGAGLTDAEQVNRSWIFLAGRTELVGQERFIRVTVTLPVPLYRRIRASTPDFSAFMTETLSRRVRNEDLAEALERTSGLMADTFGDLNGPEAIEAYLYRQRAEWNSDSGG
jgi:hypothetical protein